MISRAKQSFVTFCNRQCAKSVTERIVFAALFSPFQLFLDGSISDFTSQISVRGDWHKNITGSGSNFRLIHSREKVVWFLSAFEILVVHAPGIRNFFSTWVVQYWDKYNIIPQHANWRRDHSVVVKLWGRVWKHKCVISLLSLDKRRKPRITRVLSLVNNSYP